MLLAKTAMLTGITDQAGDYGFPGSGLFRGYLMGTIRIPLNPGCA
jgi:hypothetical protein